MNNIKQLTYNYILILTGIAVFLLLCYIGMEYYVLPLEKRFFHPLHEWWRPSGLLGHGLGIVGSLCMIVGVFTYMARKHYKKFARIGTLKNWLTFHIFLCSVGPMMVLFHTAFKFGGVVAISFWSMVAVVLSGIIGRFIYKQIPRSIQGQELTLTEVALLKKNVHHELMKINELENVVITDFFIDSDVSVTPNSTNIILSVWQDYRKEISGLRLVRKHLQSAGILTATRQKILQLIKSEIRLKRKIKHLQVMQKLFRSWHIIHLPFALIMLVIMIIHIIITLAFGYRWIF